MGKENEQEKVKINKVHVLAKVIFITFIVLLIMLIIGVLGINIYLNMEEEKIIAQNSNAINTEQITFEYGEKLSYETILEKLVKNDELLDGTNIDISINGQKINETEEYELKAIGDIKIIIQTSKEMLFRNVANEKEIVWKVEDTQKPVLFGVKDIEIEEGEKFDAKDGINAKDNIDGNLEVTIEGDIDNEKPGKYTLTAKAVDKNNNEVSQIFIVTVKEKEQEDEKIEVANNKINNSSSSSNSSKNNSSNSSSSNSSSNKNNSNSSSSNNSNKNSTKDGRLALAKAEAKRVVNNIITSGMTKREKAEAICYYITSTVSVQTNQSSEAYKTNYGNEAYAALVLKKAACSGRCKAVTLLCDAAGLESKHINQNQWTHQWNEVKIDDGTWIVIDAQIGYVGTSHPLEEN